MCTNKNCKGGCKKCNQSITTTTNVLANPCKECGCIDSNTDCGKDEFCSSCNGKRIDLKCVVYGLQDISSPLLTALNISAGDDGERIVKKINDLLISIDPLNINGIDFGYLSNTYTINSFKDFAEIVVEELEKLQQTPVVNYSPCFTFTVINKSSSIGFYNKKDCSNTSVNNISIAPNQQITFTAKGCISLSSNVEVVNNGVLN